LHKLSEEVGPKRTLLVCCKAFSGRESAFLNLTIKKIPQVVLSKCEWGRDDYSLRIASLPTAEETSAEDTAMQDDDISPSVSRRRGRPRKGENAEATLFDAIGPDGAGK
jgi:adenine-specific DNA-methyltransferase